MLKNTPYHIMAELKRNPIMPAHPRTHFNRKWSLPLRIDQNLAEQFAIVDQESKPLHCENMPMRHTAIFLSCKNDNF